jgi:hypothetical protein
MSEDEMVLAFLRAEIDSPRFGDVFHQGLHVLGFTRAQLIDNANVNDAAENQARAYLLGGARGYRRGTLLFQRFPGDAIWHRCEATVAEVGAFLYANFPTLLELSGGSRIVCDGANRARGGPDGFSVPVQELLAGIDPINARVAAGDQLPELIAVQDTNSPAIVLLEGHARATAYVIAQNPPMVPVLLGISAHMHEWRCF